MGQLAPSPQRAVRGLHSSPKGDDRKLYQASPFKNSSRRSMTAPFGLGATGAGAPARGRRQKCARLASGGCWQFSSQVPERHRAGRSNPQASI
jgi:hypothetical protein